VVESSSDNITFHDYIKKRTREDLLSCLKTFGRIQEARVEEDLNTDLVAGHWLSVIVIQGEACRIVLKVQSESKAISRLFAHTMRMKIEQVSSQQVKDFLREVCNLAAGQIKKGLANCNLDTGISLPLATRGFDNLFFKTSTTPETIEDRWKIIWGDGEIRCYSSIDILSRSELRAFQYREDMPEDNLFEEL